MECPQECPPEVYQIMRDCWDENPMRRPCFTKLIHDIDKTMLCCQVRPSGVSNKTDERIFGMGSKIREIC